VFDVWGMLWRYLGRSVDVAIRECHCFEICRRSRAKRNCINVLSTIRVTRPDAARFKKQTIIAANYRLASSAAAMESVTPIKMASFKNMGCECADAGIRRPP
jgi:hypothetical protein